MQEICAWAKSGWFMNPPATMSERGIQLRTGFGWGTLNAGKVEKETVQQQAQVAAGFEVSQGRIDGLNDL